MGKRRYELVCITGGCNFKPFFSQGGYAGYNIVERGYKFRAISLRYLDSFLS